jgi:hypothetical protein
VEAVSEHFDDNYQASFLLNKTKRTIDIISRPVDIFFKAFPE